MTNLAEGEKTEDEKNFYIQVNYTTENIHTRVKKDNEELMAIMKSDGMRPNAVVAYRGNQWGPEGYDSREEATNILSLIENGTIDRSYLPKGYELLIKPVEEVRGLLSNLEMPNIALSKEIGNVIVNYL